MTGMISSAGYVKLAVRRDEKTEKRVGWHTE